MKLFIILGLLCAIACTVQAQRRRGGGNRVGGGGGLKFPHRFRREAEPYEEVVESQGARVRREPQESTLRVHGEQHLTGRNKQPSLDVNYQRQLLDTGRTQVNAFGGGHLQNGRVSPQAGLGFQHKFQNDIFLHGGAQVRPGHHGRLEPTFAAGAGWRFRREAEPYEEEEVVESQGVRVRREPEESTLRLHGEQHLTGRNKQPSLDVNYQRQLLDTGRTQVNAFGGGHLQNGRVSPQAGLGFEHKFQNDIFLHGGAQVRPGHHGRLEPTFAAGAGWRFRRDAPKEIEETEE